MELLNSIFHFFTDKTKGLSHKAALVILSIAILIILDNTLSFSYFFNTQNKIEQVSILNQVLSDSTLTVEEIEELKNIRKDIVFRSTWKDKTWDLVSKIEFNSIQKDSTDQVSITIASERSYFWHFLSSGWIFILVMIVMPFVALSDKKTSISSIVAIIFLAEPMLLLMAWIFAKLFSFIPLLLGDPFYNYIINFFLSNVIILIISLMNKKEKKKK